MITALVWPNLRTHLIDNDRPMPTLTQSESESPIRVLTCDELAKFDGIQNDGLYLSILGSVFDVSKGARHYKSGETYHYFVGEYFE